ncbi:MAG: DoxX family membrane protein [Alkalispirochaeta sp.]
MNRSEYGTFALRIGVGLLFLIFGLLKFVSSQPMLQGVYPQFWGGLAVATVVYIIAVLQIGGALMLFLGWKTRVAAIVLGVMHLGTVIVTLPKIINPFAFPEGAPPNFLFFGGVPLLAALIALILQGNGAWSVEKKE